MNLKIFSFILPNYSLNPFRVMNIAFRGEVEGYFIEPSDEQGIKNSGVKRLLGGRFWGASN